MPFSPGRGSASMPASAEILVGPTLLRFYNAVAGGDMGGCAFESKIKFLSDLVLHVCAQVVFSIQK